MLVGCGSSSELTDTDIEAIVEARVEATVEAVLEASSESSEDSSDDLTTSMSGLDLPIVEPSEKFHSPPYSTVIIWKGIRNQRTSVFTTSDPSVQFRWEYYPAGYGFDDFSIQMIDAQTQQPVITDLAGDSTILAGSGNVRLAGDFYFIVKSNSEWFIRVSVF